MTNQAQALTELAKEMREAAGRRRADAENSGLLAELLNNETAIVDSLEGFALQLAYFAKELEKLIQS